MLTIDASVWINADSPHEVDSASSRAFLDQVAARMVIVVPTLLCVEVAAAISRKRKDAAMAASFPKKSRRFRTFNGFRSMQPSLIKRQFWPLNMDCAAPMRHTPLSPSLTNARSSRLIENTSRD